MAEYVHPYDAHKMLISGLVAGHERLYGTSAEFKACIHQLAGMLPHIVRGLAEEAEKREGEHQALIEARLAEEYKRPFRIALSDLTPEADGGESR